MAGTIDMRFMRYINLFSKISRVQTMHCFEYNNQIVFGVPKSAVSKAIGKGAENVRKMKDTIGKRTKVLVMPSIEDTKGITKFVEDLLAPIEIGKIELRGDTLIITANRQSKAAIIGRNRTREKELSDILKHTFKIPTIKIM